mmetsp:Transcript_13853/g.39453  ORF Transcript_13853/g.39453 Transcript_13853/m.39453 type:complete len:242 (-) Transcript_13853:311-1036(-)
MTSRGISHGTDGGGGRRPGGKATTVVNFESISNFFGAAIADARSRISLETIRPLPVFLGVSPHNLCLAQDAFAPPTTKLDKTSWEKVKTRLKLNFAYFMSNYAVVAAGVALVVALMHPGMLISLGTLWGLWELHAYLISHELVVFGRNLGSMVSINHRSYFLTALTAAVVAWKCLWPVVTFVAISGIIVFAHAVMRDPKQMDMAQGSQNRHGGRHGDDEYDSSGSEVVVDHPPAGGKADII